MDVPQFMKLVYGCEHFADVESGVFFLEDARVIEESAEVTAGYVFHCEVDMVRVLECVQETDKPRCFSRSQDVAFDENMSDLICLIITDDRIRSIRQVPRPS